MPKRIAAALAAVWISGAALAAHTDAGPAPEIVSALRLRARNGIEAGASPYSVHIRTLSAHHVRREASTLATRDAEGRWTVSQVSEDRPSLIVVNRLYLRRRALPADQAAKLDRLLASRRLYRTETPAQAAPPGVDAYFHTMEIVSPKGRVLARWTGEPRGRAGKVAELVMGWSAAPAVWDQNEERELQPASPGG